MIVSASKPSKEVETAESWFGFPEIETSDFLVCLSSPNPCGGCGSVDSSAGAVEERRQVLKQE